MLINDILELTMPKSRVNCCHGETAEGWNPNGAAASRPAEGCRGAMLGKMQARLCRIRILSVSASGSRPAGRNERRDASRSVAPPASHLEPHFITRSPLAAHTMSSNPLSAAALAKARQLREGKTQGHPSTKEAVGLRSLRNECGGGHEDQGSGWGFWLAVAAAVLGLFLPLSGIPGRDN